MKTSKETRVFKFQEVESLILPLFVSPRAPAANGCPEETRPGLQTAISRPNPVRQVHL